MYKELLFRVNHFVKQDRKKVGEVGRTRSPQRLVSKSLQNQSTSDHSRKMLQRLETTVQLYRHQSELCRRSVTKLNLLNQAVRAHLKGKTAQWKDDHSDH